jgi:hypothetical protein
LAATLALSCGQAQAAPECVMSRTNATLLQRGDSWVPLTEELKMPGEIKVFTNASFQIKEGKARELKEGQILRADGTLFNPDGSVMPVFDHIEMNKGRVMVYKDGEGQALSAPLALPDRSIINPDGSYSRPGGRRSRLVDGQMLTLDGVSMPSMDTITLRNGQVVVYKSGALIQLQSPVQIMSMQDGTRVRGDGQVTALDGTVSQLIEGKTMTVEGARTGW